MPYSTWALIGTAGSSVATLLRIWFLRGPITAGRLLKIALVVVVACVQLLGVGRLQASSAKMVGQWKVELAFANGEVRSVRFAAQESGKGFYLPAAPAPNQTAPAEKVDGEWLVGAEGKVVFSGTVQFPLGNVGLQRGVLVLTGKTTGDGSFMGAAKFFPPGQDPKDPKALPSKSGTFQARRVTG